jgi:hypothetical protein
VATAADREGQARRPGERDRGATSAALEARTMTAGRLSIMPFQTGRAAS